jgi:hypothetical protein
MIKNQDDMTDVAINMMAQEIPKVASKHCNAAAGQPRPLGLAAQR